MKIKPLTIFLVAIVLSVGLQAMQSVTYLTDGNVVTSTILDISSRNGQVEYQNRFKVNRTRIWMINYVESKWDYPNERKKLANNLDTVFLRNGGVVHARIIDFSSRRRVFEFRRYSAIHESKIARIYFCCTTLPTAYANARRQQTPKRRTPSRRGGTMISYLLNGRTINSPLKDLNFRKTGFQDGLQINTKDLWMINFEEDRTSYPTEQRDLDRRLDSIFLKNGEAIFDTIVDYNSSSGTFRLEKEGSVQASEISRIYFCCTAFPDAFKRYRNNKRSKRGSRSSRTRRR